ncbi:MAG: hypothetical protein KQH53_05750 [Desulfarculaceae bacterium]|nr:hypothetical protein [Desulfarculaceae bacterium]
MTPPTTLFISIWRNPSVRYFLHSEVLAGLRESGARLVFFVKDQDLSYYQDLLGGENIIFEPIKTVAAKKALATGRLNQQLQRVRRFMSGRRGGLSNTTDQTWVELYGFSTADSLRARALAKIVTGAAALGSRTRLLRHGLVALESALAPGKLYDPYFAKYRPRALVTSSVGYGHDVLFMRAARRHGCPVVSVVHSWDNPTTKGYRGADPDAAIAWNQVMADELEVFQDIPKQRVFVEGVAHWDHYFDPPRPLRSREEFCASLGLDPARKLIFYGTSAAKMFPNTFDAIESIMEAIARDAYGRPAQLLVRLHPSYFRQQKGGRITVDAFDGRIASLEQRYGSLIKFAHPDIQTLEAGLNMPREDLLGLAETLRQADLLLTEYSTLIIEAALVDTPIVNVATFRFWDTNLPAKHFENYMHLKVVLDSGACRNAYSLEELDHYIARYLADPALDGQNRAALAQTMVPVNRGRAGRAVAQRILSLSA